MEVRKKPRLSIVALVDHKLLTNGTREEISEMLQQQIDVNCINENGDTALHSILRNERLVQKDVVEFLTLCLARGVDPNKRGKEEETALHLAVERRMREAVRCLLERAADIHVVDQRGNGIAHFFIENERDKMKTAMLYPLINSPENREITDNYSRDFVKFLSDIGVDFDHKNGEGKSALHLAIVYNLAHLLPALLELTIVKLNYQELIELLLTEISSKSSSHSLDKIPTCASNHDSVLQILLDRGQFENNDDLAVLSTAIKKKREMSCIETMINYFLIRCDHVDFATKLFEELLSTCACWSDSERDYFSSVLKDLITRGVDINEVEIRERLIWTAIKTKNARLLEVSQQMGLIFLGLELEDGKNLIKTIAEEIHNEDKSSFQFYRRFVDVLVRSGCDLNRRDRYGKTALQTAMHYGKVAMVQILIDSGVDLNCRDTCGRAPLHHALMTGKAGKLIVKPPMNPLHRDQLFLPPHDHFRWTAFNSNMSENEARMIVKLLINSGVDVNARDSNYNTPLHYAVFRDDVKMMKLLLEGKANVNAKDREGNTPLQLIIASEKFEKLTNSRDMMRLLMRNGACPNVRNRQMETPLELALMLDTKLAEELLRYNADTEDARVRSLLRDLHDDKIDQEARHYYTEIGTLLCMQRHWMKLMAADLPLSIEYRNYMTARVDKKYYDQCLEEIEDLKKVSIDDQESLYDFLHMHPSRRCAYMRRNHVKQVMNSPDLINKFPEMSILVMASYQETKTFQKRKMVSGFVAEIFSRLCNFSCQEVADKIVSLLREDDILGFVLNN